MDNKLIIGFSGVARSGKNTFANLLAFRLERDFDLRVKQYALADKLKLDCEQFLSEKCKMDVWTNDTNVKNCFRDLLVAYGKIQRERTEGRYWTNLIEEQMNKDKDIFDCFFITDIRYAKYPKDEVFWLKELGGLLVHVKQYNKTEESFERIYLSPPNEEEKINDPKLQELADYKVEWPNVSKDFTKLDKYIDNFLRYLENTNRI